jgi:hypothetical protein
MDWMYRLFSVESGVGIIMRSSKAMKGDGSLLHEDTTTKEFSWSDWVKVLNFQSG